MSDYKKLSDAVEAKCPSASFNKLDQCIENIISGKSESDKVKDIKSLICHFEGKSNRAGFFSLISIGYALFIVGLSLIGSKEEVYLLMVFAAILGGVAFLGLSSYTLDLDYKNTFILKALNFKLDELIEIIETSKHEETETISINKEEKK